MADTQDGIRASIDAPAGDAPPIRAAASGDVARPAGGTPDADGKGLAAENSAARDPAAVRSFIESFTSQLVQAGFPRTPARIFVALITSDSSSLTAAELGALLQTSPASVSGGVRYLVQVGLAIAEGEPGSRRQHYRVSADVWQDIVRLRDRMFTRWAAELRDGLIVLGRDSPAGARLAETVRYFEFISGEMTGLLARWDTRKADGDSGEFRPSQ